MAAADVIGDLQQQAGAKAEIRKEVGPWLDPQDMRNSRKLPARARKIFNFSEKDDGERPRLGLPSRERTQRSRDFGLGIWD